MDIIDIWWDLSQQAAINDLRAKLDAAHLTSRSTIARQAELIRLLQQESDDLRLRLGVLVRVLVQQGALSAEQYSVAVQEAKASVALAEAQARKQRAARPRPKRLQPVPSKSS